ncbi:diamine acetyltransferase 1-like [Ornithodoros turicata]|uniref:diamine acetyltransferase 1-like n=1 Tax=Ornithodoros turicata TaxID=34597 RepID=UPI0031398EC2
MNATIRPARQTDVRSIHSLIRELAEYEKMPEQVELSCSDLEDHLFGSYSWAEANVACISTPEAKEVVAGFVLYFFIFDPITLERVVYMEDLYVRPEYRHRGLGLALWKSVARRGVEKKCDVLNWTVLDWNEPSINFYLKQGATNISLTKGYQRLRFTGAVIDTLLSES